MRNKQTTTAPVQIGVARMALTSMALVSSMTLSGVAFTGMAMAPSAAQADTLSMPAQAAPAQPGPVTAKPAPTRMPHAEFEVKMPVRGMTMNQVSRDYGPPSEKRAPVGKPPITRWVYPRYTVYFEYKYVIDSVLNTQH